VGAETPKRIRRLDFDGTRKQLEHILSALDSRSTSATSSIRLQCAHCEIGGNGEHLIRFFSSSFPKLSELDIDTFLPDSTSSILTTSNLTSLKLDSPYNDTRRYTRSQFLQVLQHHPNLKQLDLKAGGLPSVEDSAGLVPVVLPHLIDLKLCSTDEAIEGFVDLVGMSSPLHNVIIDVEHNHASDVRAPANAAKKILTAYYGCEGLKQPCKVTHLTVSSSYQFQDRLIIRAKTRSTSTFHPIYNLELKFHGMEGALAQMIIPLFPSRHIRDYAIERLDIITNDWCVVLRRMDGLLRLRLDSVDHQRNRNHFFDLKKSLKVVESGEGRKRSCPF
jgi:hypothetical protein